MSALPSAARNPLLESPSLSLSTAPTEPKLRELLTHWQNWPQTGGLPDRDQFEPADMPHLLPHLCLVEYDRHDNPFRDYDVLFRYIGTRIGEDFSMSNSTRSHMSDFGPTFAKRWFPVFDRLVETRRPVVVQGVPYLIDKTYLRFEILFLPLTRADRMQADAAPTANGPTVNRTAASRTAVDAPVNFALFGAIFGPNLAAPPLDDVPLIESDFSA